MAGMNRSNNYSNQENPFHLLYDPFERRLMMPHYSCYCSYYYYYLYYSIIYTFAGEHPVVCRSLENVLHGGIKEADWLLVYQLGTQEKITAK